MSNSLRPHGLQHTWLPCPFPTPTAYSNSCASGWWCHPTISSSVVLLYYCFQSFPASGSFPMSQFFTSVARVLEFQLQHQSFQWISGLISFRMDWLDLFTVQGTLKSLLQHHSSKASILLRSVFFIEKKLFGECFSKCGPGIAASHHWYLSGMHIIEPTPD